ncbi:MAG TPA: molecular chaperone TorD family protein [Candidatus Binataceae bacterium]|nr:molecular chaperone TorD family protein [Candidatus Binataceae bacterium]
METADNLTAVTENEASARSALYRWLAASFAFPTPEFHACVCDGEYFASTAQLMARLPYAFDPELIQTLELSLGGLASGFDDFSAEYTRLFDVGREGGRPPCPLYGGEYSGRSRLDVMEELVRFYRFFDLGLSERDRELPDHVTVELEFLHYLTFREDRTLEAAGDPSSYRRAQRDFIERHPGAWIPILRQSLEKQTPIPFFAGLIALTSEVLDADIAYLRTALSPR